MIIALAGRRIDAPDAVQKRFPIENADRVQREIRDALTYLKATALVCSAACGVDILALETAGDLGLRRSVILPYDKAAFRLSSVADRPGDWLERFDRIIGDVGARNDLLVYDYDRDQEETYFAINHDVLDTAEEMALKLEDNLYAMGVWNGEARGEDDVTAHFLEEAKRRGLKVMELSTL